MTAFATNDAVCSALIDFTHLSLSLSLIHSLIRSLIHFVIYSSSTRSFSLSFFRSLAGVLILLSLSRQLSPPFLLRKRNSTKRNRICYLDIATFTCPGFSVLLFVTRKSNGRR